ncbi:MAG: PAS domain S-box protein [Candidatus Aminicenantes bacterium]|nr:PAS domain S-box protein [Candidatus Aminicenantes bacterium]
MTNTEHPEHNPDSATPECLHYIANLSIDHRLSLEDFLQRAVKFIPLGFQNPKIICAKISFQNRSYTTKNFQKSKWNLACLIKVAGNDVGSVEVFYLKKTFPNTDDPFLKEERKLILAICSQLGVSIENKVLLEELHIKENAIASALNGVSFSDLKNKITYVNDAFLRMWGYDQKDEVLGKSSLEFAKPKSAVHKIAAQITKEGSWSGEIVGVRKDGTFFDVQVSATVVRDKFGNPIRKMACFRDITERKEAESQLKKSQEELRSLASHLLVLREQEKKRMAHKIHDELGQDLTILKMELSFLKEKLPTDHKKLIDLTKSMIKTIDKTSLSVRRISAELRPRLLDDVGLIPAIEWYIEEFQKRTRIKCEFIADNGGINPPIKISIVLFRVLQEALTNTSRHAAATRIKVSLSENQKNLIFKIKDNGKGITEKQISKPNSFGILGIRESVISINGDLKIKGIPDKSTTIEVSLPLVNGDYTL